MKNVIATVVINPHTYKGFAKSERGDYWGIIADDLDSFHLLDGDIIEIELETLADPFCKVVENQSIDLRRNS